MTDSELLEEVKKGLGITGTFQDNTLNVYIAEVKAFLIDAGVRPEVVNSSASVGVIMRGVADLWNGNASLSQYFIQRAIQISYKTIDAAETEGEKNV